MEMSKLVIIHNLKEENDFPALERWFRRYHVPEVLTSTPWLVRYLLYRCVKAPAGAEDFGYFNYRVHESWRLDKDYKRGERGLLAMTKQVGAPGNLDAIFINVPAEPTEDFFGAGWSFDEHTILRWLIAFRYPDGVSKTEGEDWYLNVHAPEMAKTPGLTRYFSHKAYSTGQTLPQADDFAQHDDLFHMQWDRVTELWFEDGRSWQNGILHNLPALTPPPWATYEKYPFIIPGREFISTFILEKPDADFTKESTSLCF